MPTERQLAGSDNIPGYTLRLVVAKDCNLNCLYCFQEGTAHNGTNNLNAGGFLRLVDNFASIRSISKIRLTGGEPLIYRDLIPLLKGLKNEYPNLDLGFTTNGTSPDKLQAVAETFADSPLHMNISIPSLNAETYGMLTRSSKLPAVLTSVKRLVASGFASQTSINFLLLQGINDSELPTMAEFASLNGLSLKVMQLTVNEFNDKRIKKEMIVLGEADSISKQIKALGYDQTQRQDVFIRGSHVIRIVQNVASETAQYFRENKTFRFYYDNRIGICGDNDGLIQPINGEDPKQTIFSIISKAEKFLDTDDSSR